MPDLLNLWEKKASWNILYDLQYGFRSKHITHHAILDIVNTYSKIWTMENFRAVLSSIYLKKASDTVNHEISLTKLKNYGMPKQPGTNYASQ